MPADRQDLEARLAAATPEDTVRGLVFNGAFSVLREHGGEEASRTCDPAGTGLRTDFFSYPVTDYLNMAWNAADWLESRVGGLDAGFYKIGHRALANVLSSMLGRTLLTIAGGDIHRLLSQTPSGYKATVSYGERTVDWPDPHHAHMVFRRDFLVPPFHCGVIAAAVEMAGGRNIRATGRKTGFLEAEYDVTWE